MKNSIHIDMTNNCLCDLVSSVNDGTNRIILTIICDVSLNPRLTIGSTTITLTNSNSEYEITTDSLPVGTDYVFTLSDDEHTGNQFTIHVPNELGSNWLLKQISNFEYQISKKDESSGIAQTLLNMVYPVGAIYMSANNISPQTFLGGTWEQIKDRFLLSAGNSYQAGATGGAATVSLAVANLPSHNHSIPALSGTAASAGAHTHNMKYNKDATTGGKSARVAGNGANTSGGSIMTSAGAHTHNVTTNASTTGNQGSGTAHNNMPPYLTVYMWKRTA